MGSIIAAVCVDGIRDVLVTVFRQLAQKCRIVFLCLIDHFVKLLRRFRGHTLINGAVQGVQLSILPERITDSAHPGIIHSAVLHLLIQPFKIYGL